MCLQLHIFPHPYLIIKESMLSEYARNGHLSRRQARDLIKIDSGKSDTLYDFFVENGWIKAQPSFVSAGLAFEQGEASSSSEILVLNGNDSISAFGNGGFRTNGVSGMYPASSLSSETAVKTEY
ncbi:Transcriptional adapter ada2 [Coemansia sp. RSA 486]|nr:Transcriptional adapter ada2 [Coemansia sp. RSA 486]